MAWPTGSHDFNPLDVFCVLAWSQESKHSGKTGTRGHVLETVNEYTIGVRNKLWWHAVAVFSGITGGKQSVRMMDILNICYSNFVYDTTTRTYNKEINCVASGFYM